MESVEREPLQYCDIVMKGGITSGVVYPLAAVELAEKHGYSFRNVGGTSAGAIAAAAVAAAEFGRRSGSNPRSYERIAGLPDDLGTTLTSLFQPSVRMRPLFKTLLAGLGGGIPRKLVAPLRGFWLEAIAGAIPGAALLAIAILLEGDVALLWATGACGAIALLVGPYLAVAASAVLRLRGLPRHYFGICPGNDRKGDAKTPPLTRWLADLIDELAGRGIGLPPLTFGDLWDLEPGGGAADERGIDLQMMTTNLSQGRPYSLPFQESEELWFDAEEFRGLFPSLIVNHLVEHSTDKIDAGSGKVLRRLPKPRQLPVVVAARMSLSFPLLIGAVPLYARNDAPKVPGDAPERCWFSDGGITSNFPVHFFDSPIPRWPTFAINLMPLAPDRQIDRDDERENVWMPADNSEGVEEAWVGWEGKANRKQIFAFAGSIFRTAQNWIDNRQMRGAGYRDRIAHVRLAKDEGGMNLRMDPEDITRLAARGAAAASMLAERFGPVPSAEEELIWDNQKWIRYRTYMDLLERKGFEARRGFRDGSLGTPLSELSAAPPDFPWDGQAQGGLALPATWALVTMFWAWDVLGAGFSDGAPGPPTEPWSIPRV
jgi:predicted acylesterase/phospholipase RssA